MNIKRMDDVGPIVLVDDNRSDQLIAKHVYMRSDLPNPLLLFEGGRPFLDHMSKVSQGQEQLPALILMDINMPGMDGFRTIVLLREQPAFKEVPPIIMLTNSDRQSDKETAYEVGADGFQTKSHHIEKYIEFFNSLA